jgi:farnesyl diphosphate synthase
MKKTDVERSLSSYSEALNRRISELLTANNDPASPPQLVEAMLYGVRGGKRFRPFLAAECASLFGLPLASCLDFGCAIECFHCHSLIYDDLPAMDNDPTRRGLPTVHVAFGEATAILAASCLSLIAFEIIADAATHRDPEVRAWLVGELASVAGPRGMAGGQLLDLMTEGGADTASPALIERINSLKTASLIRYACVAGAKLAGASDPDLRALARYGNAIGLAFQIADDLLDADGSDAASGEKSSRGACGGKATYVSVVGRREARVLIEKLAETALSTIAPFGERGSTLADIVHFVVHRSH